MRVSSVPTSSSSSSFTSDKQQRFLIATMIEDVRKGREWSTLFDSWNYKNLIEFCKNHLLELAVSITKKKDDAFARLSIALQLPETS